VRALSISARDGTSGWFLKWVKIRAARTGVSDSAVIEESLRRDLKLDVLDGLWSAATMSEAKAAELALEAQHGDQTSPTGIWCAASLTSTS
jgi:hypothetical protein